MTIAYPAAEILAWRLSAYGRIIRGDEDTSEDQAAEAASPQVAERLVACWNACMGISTLDLLTCEVQMRPDPPNASPPATPLAAVEFPGGMTVADLKSMIRDWPETDEYGDPCEVWLCSGDGISNQAKLASPLNMRHSDDDSEVRADFLLGHDA